MTMTPEEALAHELLKKHSANFRARPDPSFVIDGRDALSAIVEALSVREDVCRSLRECREILSDLTGDDASISVQSLFLRSVAAEARARIALGRIEGMRHDR